jgi:hypothetical protein
MNTNVLSAADYYINFMGRVIDIPELSSDRLYILFESGSGSGDQSYWCSFSTTYGVYRAKDYGKTLERIGEIHEISGTDRKCFNGTVEGKAISLDGFTADSVFMKIFKRDF